MQCPRSWASLSSFTVGSWKVGWILTVFPTAWECFAGAQNQGAQNQPYLAFLDSLMSCVTLEGFLGRLNHASNREVG